MSHDRTLSRIRIAATLLLIAIAAETLRYTYTSFDRAYSFAFGNPDLWNNHYLADPSTIVPMGARIQYFAIWGGIILLSLACYLIGLFILNSVRRGRIFEPQTASAVWWLGLTLAVAMVADLIFHAVDAALITRFNAEPLPVRWAYDPSDLKSLSLALILFLFGWIMRQSIEIEKENRGFV